MPTRAERATATMSHKRCCSGGRRTQDPFRGCRRRNSSKWCSKRSGHGCRRAVTMCLTRRSSPDWSSGSWCGGASWRSPFRRPEGLEDGVVEVPWSRPRHTRKRDLVLPKGGEEGASRPIRPEARAKLLLSIARGRAWVEELMSGQVMSTHELAAREGLSERSVRMTLSLAFLAPDLVKAALDGRLTRGTGVDEFCRAAVRLG